MIRAFVQERAGCNCWYCSRRRAEREQVAAPAKPSVVPAEPEWSPYVGAAS